MPLEFYRHMNHQERTLISMAERTSLSVSQVTDEVLYKGLVQMEELPELGG